MHVGAHSESTRMIWRIILAMVSVVTFPAWWWTIWGLCCQKQVSQTGISNSIPQYSVGCTYLARMRYLLLVPKSCFLSRVHPNNCVNCSNFCVLALNDPLSDKQPWSTYVSNADETTNNRGLLWYQRLAKPASAIGHGYRNWYQYWGHCCLINDLGSSPQPEGEARWLWWASQVVNETTMTEIEVSISILSWWN